MGEDVARDIVEKLKNKYSIDLKNSDTLIKLQLSLVALEISEKYNLDLENK